MDNGLLVGRSVQNRVDRAFFWALHIDPVHLSPTGVFWPGSAFFKVSGARNITRANITEAYAHKSSEDYIGFSKESRTPQ